MAANRTQYFYQEVTLAASYTEANSFSWKFSSRHIRLHVSGGNMEYSLIGNNSTIIDGKILDGENIPFDGLETQRIAVRGTGTARIWAYK